MKRLLNQTENRRLLAIEILYEQNDWITLSTLAKKLDCSLRVLKEDMAYFNKNCTAFTIESSNYGVRIVLHKNAGMKILYQYTLKNSTAYNLLENIFLKNEMTVKEITKLLSLGSSTVYRLIDQINSLYEDVGFKIATNPCRIVGNEKEIRYFFYNYFHETYPNLYWPYENIDEVILDRFLQFFIEYTGTKADFAYYNIFKTVSVVNLIRYKHGYLVDASDIQVVFDKIISDLAALEGEFSYFEEENQLMVDKELLLQVFTPFIQEEFSFDFEHLIEKSKSNQQILKEVHFLNDLLEDLSIKHQLSIHNKENIILNIHNACHLEYYELRSEYILHNHKKEFVKKIKIEFPTFYEDLYRLAKDYRKLMNKPLTEDGINFIIYMVFSTWGNLLSELRRKYEKITILVLSDRHTSHSLTIKDVIEYEFHEQIVVDVYKGTRLNHTMLNNLEYDILVANFPLPVLDKQRTIYIENLPTFFDISKIRETVDEIILERISLLFSNNKS